MTVAVAGAGSEAGRRGIRPARLLAAASCLLALGSAAAQVAGSSPVRVSALRLDARIDPDSASIRCRAELRIRALSDGVEAFDLWLNQGFQIEMVQPGRTVDLRWERQRPAPPFVPGARPLRVAWRRPLASGEERRLVVFYRGRLPAGARGVDGIGEDRVELGLYSGWYPRVVGAGEFEVELTADLPAAFRAASPLAAGPEEGGKRRHRVRFAGRSRAEDVVLLAVPGVSARERSETLPTLRLLHAGLPPATADALLDAARGVLDHHRIVLGLPPPEEPVTLFVTPRPGSCYTREPLVVLSLDAVADGLDPGSRRGRRALQTVAHEIGHLWFRLASHYRPDDWLNEALAEYAALRAMAARGGPAVAREIVDEYRDRLATLGHPFAIGVTLRGDPDAEMLFYAKGALVLRLLGRVIGEEALDRALGAYYRRFAGEPSAAADTVAFREIVEREAGRDLVWFFQPWVYDAFLPRLSLDYRTEGSPPRVRVSGTVAQRGEQAFRLPVDLEARGGRGERQRFNLEAAGAETAFAFELPFLPEAIVIDPEALVPRAIGPPSGEDEMPGESGEIAAVLRMARDREEHGEGAEAARLYALALRARPDDFYALYRLGRLASAREDPQRALRYHLRAEAGRSGYPRLWGWNLVRIGETRRALGDPAGAAEAFARALAEDDALGSREAARGGLRTLP